MFVGVPGLISTRVQLWRADALDRADAWAYRWRTTVTRAPGRRRSWSEGVLLAHPEQASRPQRACSRI
jgi:hypothetical protein